MRKKFNRVLFFVIICLVLINTTRAQEIKPVNASVWVDVFFQQTLSNKLRYLIHSNYKFAVSNGDYKQIMLRPAIIYMLSDHLYFQGGFNFFYTMEDDINLYEIRTWQGMNVFFPRIGNVYINNFLRIEQRFFYEDEIELPNFIRGRYAIQANIPLTSKTMSPKTIYLWPNIEFFADLVGKNINTFITRERFSFGVGYVISEKIRVETVYMYERLRENKDDLFELENNIFRGIFRYSLPYREN